MEQFKVKKEDELVSQCCVVYEVEIPFQIQVNQNGVVSHGIQENSEGKNFKRHKYVFYLFMNNTTAQHCHNLSTDLHFSKKEGPKYMGEIFEVPESSTLAEADSMPYLQPAATA